MIDQHGLPLADALALLRAHVPPNAILVGQVRWLYSLYTITNPSYLHPSCPKKTNYSEIITKT